MITLGNIGVFVWFNDTFFFNSEITPFLYSTGIVELPRAPNCINFRLNSARLSFSPLCYDTSQKRFFLIVKCRQNSLKSKLDDWNLTSSVSNTTHRAPRHKSEKKSSQRHRISGVTKSSDACPPLTTDTEWKSPAWSDASSSSCGGIVSLLPCSYASHAHCLQVY